MAAIKRFNSQVVRSFVESRRRFKSERNRDPGLVTGGCQSFVKAFKDFAEHRRTILDGLFSESNRYLYPFVDPLRTDMMLPGFLTGEREELYSDMLAWVFSLLPAHDVFHVLGISGLAQADNIALEFSREYYISDAESGGRFDLLISQGDAWLAVIELKTKDYDQFSLTKHELYHLAVARSATEQKCAKIFIARQYTGDDLKGFEFLSWADLCIRLRERAVAVIETRPYTQAALFLAFIASIEQNLIRLYLS